MKRLLNPGVALFASLLLMLSAADARADVIRLGPSSFTPAASNITFSEFAVGTVNPTYTFTGVPNLGAVTVSFGGSFVGQVESGTSPRTLSDNTPSGPLTLNPSASQTRIVADSANPTSPVLSGTPTFNGPISILLSQPVAAIGLDGGFFDSIGGTSIEAYDANGNVLGRVTNSALGIEFFGLADSSGANIISGITFFVTGNEPAGFGIDNVRFGTAQVLVNPPGAPVPEPATMLLLGTGLAGVVARLRKRRRGHGGDTT